MYKGSYKGLSVAIKTLRIPAAEEEELARLKKVSSFVWESLKWPEYIRIAIIQRSDRLETLRSS